MEFAYLKELDDKYIMNTYKRYPLQVIRGEGVFVFDEKGKKYLDFLSGIAVNALGYGHPKILKVIKEQSEDLIHISNLFYTQPPVMLAKKLCKISGMDKVFFSNSGAEANELAVKLAHAKGRISKNNKHKIICMESSFHGRTIAALSLTKSDKYGDKFAPLVEGVVFVPFNDNEVLENTFNDDIAAIIIEPVQGEGGINLAKPEYLKLARDLADRHDAILIFDEVQAGLGRTGELFGHTSSNVEPDIITLAKPLGAGLPIGAVLMNDSSASILTYGDHGSTFGGNCLVTATALTFLEVLEEEDILNNVKNMGKLFLERLNKLKDRYSFIKEVRGKGLILGVELDRPPGDIILKLIEFGLICNCTSERVIRFLPPLVITENHVDMAIEIIEKVFDQINK